ncbi:MAG: tetratricopeptide repeat protein [Myxococcota bacterium]
MLVGLSATVFTLWMLVDARQRRVDEWWYLIIVMPLGEWAYFFAVKVRDYEIGFIERLWEPPAPSLETLKRRLDQTPSDENRLQLGWALLREGKAADALEHFHSVARRDPNDPSALHGMGLARIDMNEPAAAVAPLARVVETKPSHDDYEVWHDLAYAHWESENRLEAVAALRQLVSTSPRVKHKVLLGTYLARMGERDEARALLEEALNDYTDLPRGNRRGLRSWLKQARDELGGL